MGKVNGIITDFANSIEHCYQFKATTCAILYVTPIHSYSIIQHHNYSKYFIDSMQSITHLHTLMLNADVQVIPYNQFCRLQAHQQFFI